MLTLKMRYSLAMAGATNIEGLATSGCRRFSSPGISGNTVDMGIASIWKIGASTPIGNSKTFPPSWTRWDFDLKSYSLSRHLRFRLDTECSLSTLHKPGEQVSIYLIGAVLNNVTGQFEAPVVGAGDIFRQSLRHVDAEIDH